MTQRLNSFFNSSQELRQISGKVRQLRAFQAHYAQIAPPSLLKSSHILHIEQGILTLAATNGAVASKLHQMMPELIRQLQLRGCEVTGIQVKVQVAVPLTRHLAPKSTLSAEVKQQLTDLAGTLAESPLKNAIQRLAKYNNKN